MQLSQIFRLSGDNPFLFRLLTNSFPSTLEMILAEISLTAGSSRSVMHDRDISARSYQPLIYSRSWVLMQTPESRAIEVKQPI